MVVCVQFHSKRTPIVLHVDHQQDQLNVNFLGTVTMSQAMLPALEDAAAAGAQPVLAVVNSFAARLPIKEMAAYTASKAALAGWVDAVRPELVCIEGLVDQYMCMGLFRQERM